MATEEYSERNGLAEGQNLHLVLLQFGLPAYKPSHNSVKSTVSDWDDEFMVYDLQVDPVRPSVVASTKIKTAYGSPEALAVDDEDISNPVFYWTAQAMLCKKALKGQPKPQVYPCTGSGTEYAVCWLCGRT